MASGVGLGAGVAESGGRGGEGKGDEGEELHFDGVGWWKEYVLKVLK